MAAKELFDICKIAEYLPKDGNVDGMTFIGELELLYTKNTVYRDTDKKYWIKLEVKE